MDVLRRLVPSAIRRRYAVKFGIVLLILGLGVGMVGFIATAGITGQVEDRVQNDHTSIASQEAQNLQMWNEQNEHTIGVIAWSDVVDSGDEAAVEQRFLDWEEHLDADTFAISYVDTDEDAVLASTDSEVRDGAATGIEGVSEDAYDEAHAMEGVPWVSEAYTVDRELSDDEQVAVITYVLSVPGEDDEAIVYTAELEAYTNRLDSDDDEVTTMILDGENNVMADNKGYGEDHETLGIEYGGDIGSIVDPARTEGAGTHQVAGSSLNFDTNAYEFGDEDYVVSSSRVHGTDWVVVTHEPESQAYGFVNTVNDWGYIATLVGVLMIGLIGAVLGRNTAVSIDRLTGKASQMEEGDLDVDLETKRVDNIGRLYQGFDSMRVALREQIEEAEAAREEAERERERIEEINGQLERKADEYSDVMEAAADGDLTARMDADTDNEAMEEIGEEFNQMLEEIEGTVAELNQFATDVATASEQVTASSEEVRSASQQVTESVQEISDGAEQQNQSLQSVNQEMSGLSTTTEEIAASSNEVADIAERTVNTGQEGQQAAQEAITAMDEIETEAGGAVDEIRRLEEEVQQIDELINTISEIARQTNMLALNANIEASRSASGSDDEGFSVVAKEVKALSEDVAEAADEAEDRLEAIRERTEQSAAEVEGTSEQIEDAGEQVEEAVKALEEIADLAQETNVGVQEISAATEEQAASTQEVVAMVDDAATISEETTSEAENVAAAAEEQTTALTEVTKSASNLSGQAAQLSEALDRFETDADRAELDMDFDLPDDDDDGGPAPTAPEFGAADEADASEEIQGQGITLESDETDVAAPAETDDPEPEQSAETFQADSTDAAPNAGPTDGAPNTGPTDSAADTGAAEPTPEPDADAPDSEPIVTDSEPAASPELDAEPVADAEADVESTSEAATDAEPTPAPEPEAEQRQQATDASSADGEATELGAEEILGLEEHSDTVAGDHATESVEDADSASDPLADDAAQSTTDPLADDAAASPESADADDASDPDERTDSETDADVDAGAEQTADDGDDSESEDNDDVFTFGNTDNE